MKNNLKKFKPGFFELYDSKQKKSIILRFMLIGAGCALLLGGILLVILLISRHDKIPVSSVLPSQLSDRSSSHNSTRIDSTEVPLNTDAQLSPNSNSNASEPTSITVTFTGDCTLGTDEAFDFSTSLNSCFEEKGSDYFFQNVRSYFEGDDLTVVNFEGTLTTSTQRCENLYAFKGDPAFTSILTSSSVEAANVANNHSHDYGEQGFTDTMENLTKSGVTPFGYDTTAVIDVKGVKVGLVGIYELYDHLERTQQLKDNIAKVKADGAQLIIVEFHWGNEKETIPDSNQTTLGHLAVDEGADVVIGHHSHVIQPLEKYNGRYIAYSMANFCFGGNSSPSDMDTFLFQQTFTVDGTNVSTDDDIHIVPCSISSADNYNNYQPTPVEGQRAQRILNRVMAPLS